MNEILEQLSDSLTSVIVLVLCFIMVLGAITMDSMVSMFPSIGSSAESDNIELSIVDKPILEIEEIVTINQGDTYNPTSYIITATSADGGIDLKNDVMFFYQHTDDRIIDTVNTSVSGSREVKFMVTYNNVSTIKKQVVIVKEYGVIE